MTEVAYEPRQARRFTEFDYAPFPPGVIFADDKIGMRAAIRAAGLRAPALIATFGSPQEVELSTLPERFVLKATNLTAKEGVFLLTRRNERYWEMLRRRVMTLPDMMTMIESSARRRGREAASLVAEELIVGENGPEQIPFDYKLYTFDGTPRMVLQIDRNHRKPLVAFFDGSFVPLPDSTVPYINGRSAARGPHIRPANWRDLIDTAAAMAKHIDIPFVSVDTYTTGDAVLIGELSGAPGGPYYGMFQFSDAFDGELGAYYRLALEKRAIAIPIVEIEPPVLRAAREREANERRRGVRRNAALLAAALANGAIDSLRRVRRRLKTRQLR